MKENQEDSSIPRDEELKPCPFCGSDGVVWSDCFQRVRCTNCYMGTAAISPAHARTAESTAEVKTRAVAAWNTRASVPTTSGGAGEQNQESGNEDKELAALIPASAPPRAVASPDLNQWQPIETAPKDRAPILLYLTGEGWHGPRQCDIVVAIWTGERWYAISDGAGGVLSDLPSHWMPLPEPPNTQATNTAKPVDSEAAVESSVSIDDCTLRGSVEITVFRGDKVLAVNSRNFNGFCGVGGKVEIGESFEHAARRELLEETDCTAKSIQFVAGHTLDPIEGDDQSVRWYCAGFVVDIGDQEPRQNEEGTVPFWTTKEEMVQRSLFPEWYAWWFDLLEKRSVPSGQREAFDAAIEIVKERTWTGGSRSKAVYLDNGIIYALEAARDTPPASIGYDQRTLTEACKTAESATRAFIARSLDPDDSSLLHSRNDYWQRGKGAEFVLEQLRTLATTPAPKGEK